MVGSTIHDGTQAINRSRSYDVNKRLKEGFRTVSSERGPGFVLVLGGRELRDSTYAVCGGCWQAGRKQVGRLVDNGWG